MTRVIDPNRALLRDADEVNGRFDGWTWPGSDVDPDRSVRHSRREVLHALLWPALFVLFLIQVITHVLDGHYPRWQVVAVTTLVVVFATSLWGSKTWSPLMTWGYWPIVRQRIRTR